MLNEEMKATTNVLAGAQVSKRERERKTNWKYTLIEKVQKGFVWTVSIFVFIQLFMMFYTQRRNQIHAAKPAVRS